MKGRRLSQRLIIELPPSPDELGPLSTTAKFEEYEKRRAEALQITPSQLRKIPESERDDNVFQYLTPDEIWILKDALLKSVPPTLIELRNSDSEVSPDDKHITVDDVALHEKKRQEFLSLTDNDLARKPIAEIETYYQFLTPDEILDHHEKLKALREA